MNTPTTDQWETWLRRKNERGWHDGFHINKGDEAKGLCDLLNNLERERDEARDAANKAKAYKRVLKETNAQLKRERDEARGELAGIEDKMRVELGGHPNSGLWGEAGLIAATMRCVDALGEVTDQRDEARGQRDRLAEVIEAASVLIAAKGRHNTMLAYNGLREALQSLTTNAKL